MQILYQIKVLKWEFQFLPPQPTIVTYVTEQTEEEEEEDMDENENEKSSLKIFKKVILRKNRGL